MPRPPDFPNLIAWLGAVWLVAALALLGLDIWHPDVRLHWTTDFYLGATLVMSLGAFLAMGLDKFKASHNARRIPESILHIFELLGGWAGSMLGQRIFHHKTHKVIYQVVFYVIVLIHFLLMASLVYFWWNRPVSSSEPAPAAASEGEPAEK